MSLMSAAALASLLSFIVFGFIAGWYVVPWLRTQERAVALEALLWLQAFRYVALQIFSAQKFGFAVSAGAGDQIAYGDVAGTLIAVAAIVALHHRARIGIALAWLQVVETIVDLTNATMAGMRENLFDTASGLTWLILTFYVPALWIGAALVAWQLYARRREAIARPQTRLVR